MAEKVFKGITCPSCGGELDLREGIKTFNCKYCNTLLLTKGIDGAVKYYVPKKIQRNIAIQNTMNWLSKGLAKARGLGSSSKIDDAFLVYIPYWRIRSDVIGWVFGQERRTRTSNGRTQTYYVDVERKIQKSYDKTYPACDIGELGVKKVNLTGDIMKPVNFEELQSEGMMFNIISSEKEITEKAKIFFIQDAINSAKVDRITFQHQDLVRPDTSVVYYPLWIVRYIFAGKTYQVVVDGEDGTICYGKAPGNNLYRAVMGIIGTAAGMYLATFFGIFGIIEGDDSLKFALSVYVVFLIIGIFLMKWGYKKFRYGGEVEEGTGMTEDIQDIKPNSISGQLNKMGEMKNVMHFASNILRK